MPVHIDNLRSEYHKLNVWWQQVRTAFGIVQDRNISFVDCINGLEESMKQEVAEMLLKPSVESRNVGLILSDLLEAIEQNIGIYEQNHEEFQEQDYAGLYEKRKNRLEREITVAKEILNHYVVNDSDYIRTRKEIENLEDRLNLAIFYDENWFKRIYERSKGIRDYILKFQDRGVILNNNIDSGMGKRGRKKKEKNPFSSYFYEGCYDEVINTLVKNKYIHPETGIWIDPDKGSKFLALSNVLFYNGYRKDMTQEQVVDGFIETFGGGPSLATVKARRDTPKYGEHKREFELMFPPKK